MVQRKPLISRITSFIQRQVIKANEKDEDELLQTKEASDGTPALSPSVESHLNNMRGDGQLLPSVRASFEPRFGHDFSRISTHSPVGGAVQTKLAINKPGDEYEQEADRVSEQVMRMPDPKAAPFRRMALLQISKENVLPARVVRGHAPHALKKRRKFN